ncbi:MAG: discoidin domain-containing protein [Deltaproteobacteria bacterium]
MFSPRTPWTLAVAICASSAVAHAQPVDRTAESGATVTARGDNASYNEGIAQLVDDGPQTKWLDFAPTTWVQVDFGGTSAGAYAVTSYALTSANDYPERDPADWTLSGSDDGTSWTVLDTRTGETFSTRFAVNSYAVGNTTAYRYYRLDLTNAAGAQNAWAPTQLAELELFAGSASPPPPVCGDGTCEGAEDSNTCPADCGAPPPPPPPPASDLTSGASVTARGEYQWVGDVATNLVDDDAQTKWRDDAAASWVEIDLYAAYAVDGYSLTSANDAWRRDPSAWTLSGSNDGASWTTVDNRANESFGSRLLTRSFTANNVTAFRYWRFDFTNSGASETQLAEIELFASGGAPTPVCGDGTCNGAEDSSSCPTDCGPPPPVCGDGTCNGAEDSASCPADCGAPPPPPPAGVPTYSGGTCPTLQQGMNLGFYVANANPAMPTAPGASVTYRDVEIRLPANPNGAPVVFTWHWYGGTSDRAIDWTGLGGTGYAENFIVVSPVSVTDAPQNDVGYFEWYTGAAPNGNPDLELAEDMLACLYDQFGVDLDRVYATGHSAGAMFVSYLLQHWSHRLAAAATMSGGEQYIASYLPASDRSNPPYATPSYALPVLAVHGGAGDIFYSSHHTDYSFMDGTQLLADDLTTDGSAVVICDGGFGHQIPPPQNTVTVSDYLLWPFFLDHPRTGTPYASSADFPASFPNGWCAMN